MAIVRKTVIFGSERTSNSTILGIAVIDYNEADPPASKQVGQSMAIEVVDDPVWEQATFTGPNAQEDHMDSILEDARELILKTVVAESLEEVAARRMSRG
ncbi:MAG: hypothetical protein VW683_05340 [Betaproteobacteria bacterium]